ncbi:hypothetical protein Mapa_010353 [Marchantia paleacea]|nr:hypothetical protein Mapa_010353 [Marchantia paleacea]
MIIWSAFHDSHIVRFRHGATLTCESQLPSKLDQVLTLRPKRETRNELFWKSAEHSRLRE